ncbi:hypothetical protein AB3331_09985 [Streptococcus sp. H49]|uniref:hypothetical protein n=1 Tax=Streptococcus huangxiaojuni TaxID=3237239 RepID=UPI0034A250E1
MLRKTCSRALAKEYLLPLVLIVLSSFLLVLPQILTRGVITGSDFLFHYNRFYETAQQIKTGNFSYFISLYGFHESARIINALYGPYFAYVQGFILLLCKNWYTYQIVSRFLLSSIAGLSIYRLIRRAAVRPSLAFLTALFYMTTFSVQYWTFRQGFSSWGAAFMPWCLIPALDFIKEEKVDVLRLAVSVALLLQVHVLSAFLLVVAYLPIYGCGFIMSKKKWPILKKGLAAALLGLLLSANIWAGFLEVGSTNSLVEPFINSKLYIMTVNQRSLYWLTSPLPLLLILLYQLYFSFRHWRHYDRVLKLISFSFFAFFILSSSIFPWYKVSKLNLSLVNLIQFPFRFFVPATIFLLLAFAMMLDRYFFNKRPKLVLALVSACLVWGLAQNSVSTLKKIVNYHTSETPVLNQKHQFVYGNAEDVKRSFYLTDLKDLLMRAIKSTPDYLPTDKTNKENKYLLYERYIFENSRFFTASQHENKLILKWTADNTDSISLPIIKYGHTRLVLNGKELSADDYRLTAIGTPEIRQQKGVNSLQISYQAAWWFKWVLIINLSSWLLISLWPLYRFLRQRLLDRKQP